MWLTGTELTGACRATSTAAAVGCQEVTDPGVNDHSWSAPTVIFPMRKLWPFRFCPSAGKAPTAPLAGINIPSSAPRPSTTTPRTSRHERVIVAPEVRSWHGEDNCMGSVEGQIDPA